MRDEKFQPETSTCWRVGNFGPIYQKSAFETVQFLQSILDIQTYVGIYVMANMRNWAFLHNAQATCIIAFYFYTSALRLLAPRGCEHLVFAEGALWAPRQFKNV